VTAVTLFTVTLNQSRFIQNDITKTDEYFEAMNAVDITANLIRKRSDLTIYNVQTILSEIQSTVSSSNWGKDVTINYDNETHIITISLQMLNGRDTVRSFLSPSSGTMGAIPVSGSTAANDLTNFMPFMQAMTPTEYKAAATVVSMSFLDAFLEANNITDINTDFTPSTMASIVENVVAQAKLSEFILPLNVANNTVSGYTGTSGLYLSESRFHDGDLTIAATNNVTIAPGQVLFVNGNLTIQSGNGSNTSMLKGIVFVRGDVIVGQHVELDTTIYVGDDVTVDNNSRIGSQARPAFIFANDAVTVGNILETSVAFIFSSTFHRSSGSGVIAGMVYAGSITTQNKNIDYNALDGQSDLNPFDLVNIFEDFYNFGLPVLVGVGGYESTDPRLG
jgi:hypothetical protein